MAELQARMAGSEFAAWAAYREDNGEIAPHRAIHRAAAVVAQAVIAAQGGKADRDDFLPYPDNVEFPPDMPDVEVSLLRAFGAKPPP